MNYQHAPMNRKYLGENILILLFVFIVFNTSNTRPATRKVGFGIAVRSPS